MEEDGSIAEYRIIGPAIEDLERLPTSQSGSLVFELVRVKDKVYRGVWDFSGFNRAHQSDMKGVIGRHTVTTAEKSI
jgi:hypothetical protein